MERRERTVGRFQYEVTLPSTIEESGVTADLEEGVLVITAPKPEHERPRRIPIR